MLESFLNVGINETIAEGMATMPRHSWAAWDSYRRFLQFWGMSLGLGRHLFDELMSDAKQRHGVPKKALLEPLQMKELAQRYRALLDDHGLRVIDEPFAQLLACIELAHRSWHSEHARLYRRALHIAEEWETAVLVQRMVFGNLDAGAGSGVLLTRHPRHESGSREPYGDFVVQGQGDDVVAGLVETHPITESQRRREAPHSPLSLERDFPAIYGELAAMARTLVQDHGMNHQEIEFTFESPRPADLYILQTRDTVLASGSLLPAFEPTPELEDARIAAGIGVGGGALSGRVAHTAHDVAELRRRHPGDDVILLRRDTVPDDIPLMLHVDGLLTSLGGATSHAAVAAKRVGKTCVVGCRLLRVSEREGHSRIGDHEFLTGDRLSIDGMDGSVYLGAHPIAEARVRGRAQQ
jgi:pyruvate, orthophosphate dikinase